MTDRITILYTQNIRGQLYMLPRLATLIKRLRRERGPVQMLIDLGNSCADSAYICRVTGGRASVIMLDAMGYDAVNVSGFLPDDEREKLLANYLSVALVDEHHTFERAGVLVAAKAAAALRYRLHIALATSPETHLMPEAALGYIYTLHLRTLQATEVGSVTLGVSETDVDLLGAAVHALAPNTLPDPTIAGTLDFVQAEANQYARKQDDGQSD
jgi:hypothetical protein